jgi:hypothetical protein
MQRQDLERLSREQLIAEAEQLGIPRPRVLTQPELVDEIIGRTTKGARERAKARGWLGRARDLLARVVERGLHLPEAARALRRGSEEKGWPVPPPPLPTVTLAEIYAAQGHLERAIAVLDEVLAREPDHREARAMRARFTEQAGRARPRAKEREMEQKDDERDAPVSDPASTPSPAASASASDERVGSIGEPANAAPVEGADADQDQDQGQDAGGSAAVLVESHVPAQAVEAAAASEEAKAPAGAIAQDGDEEDADEKGAHQKDRDTLAAAQGADVLAADAVAAEDAALPERYGVDEIVAVAVDPRTIYLYWEVRPTTLAHARARTPEGWLALRVATVTASWEGPLVDARDLRVDALYGDRFLRDVQPGSNVRVSVGWRSDAAFEPFAIGTEVTAPRAVPVETVAQEVARWEADPVVAPFQTPAPSPLWTSPPSPMPHGARPAAAGSRSEPDAARPAPRASRPLTSPVDTGIAHWGDAAEEHVSTGSPETVETVDFFVSEGPPVWVAIGSSELARSSTRTTRVVRVGRPVAVAPLDRFGGASDLSRP